MPSPVAAFIALELPAPPVDVIGHLAILHTNRPALIATHTGSELAATIVITLFLRGRSREFRDARAKHLHRQLAVSMLRSLRLAADLDTSRPMTGAHSRIGLVAVLPAGTRPAHGLDVDIVRPDRSVESLRLREHRDRDRARLHATTLLGLRHALPSMPARLAREQHRSTAARDHERGESGPLFDNVDVKETSARRGEGRS